ncbi:MAG: M1 family aminopeptidase [Bacteroidota bacterium]
MILTLFRFELSYQFRQPYLPLFALLFLALGLMTGRQELGEAGVAFNAAYRITFLSGTLSLSSVFIIMFAVGTAVQRDRRYQMEEIIFSSGLRKWQFYWLRFGGAVLCSLLAITPFLLGFWIGISFSDLAASRVAPFRFMSYFWPWFCLFLPNVFICSALIYVASAQVRGPLVPYVVAVAIYGAYWLGAVFLNSPLLAQAAVADPENMAIAAVASPFGLAAFFEQSQYWTPAEKNVNDLQLTGYFLWNRLLWFVISAAVLGFGYHRFRLQLSSPKKSNSFRWWRIERYFSPKSVTPSPLQPEAVWRGLGRGPCFTKGHQWRAFTSSLRRELSFIFGHLAFLGIYGFWLLVIVNEIYNRVTTGGDYREGLYPTTNLLIEQLLTPLPFFALILVIFYAGELVWRERELKLNSITDALPVSNLVFFGSKLGAVIILAFSLLVGALCVCLGYQLLDGEVAIQAGVYLGTLYYQAGRLLFFAAAAVSLHGFVRHKFLGMLFGLLVLIPFATPAGLRLGLIHPLLRPGHLPSVAATDMTGFGPLAQAYHWQIGYALAWVFLFILLGSLLWQRGVRVNWRQQFRHATRRLARWQMGLLAMIIALFVISVGGILQHLNADGPYRTEHELLDLAEDYERKYQRYAALEELYPISLSYEIDLFPTQRAYQVRAKHWLKNKGALSVDSIFLHPRIPLESVDFPGAELLFQDSLHGCYLFRLGKPLAPGDTLPFTYSLRVKRGVFNGRQDLVSSGSFLRPTDFEPSLGYRPSREIDDPREREQRGLPSRSQEQVTAAHLELPASNKIGRVSFDCMLSTEEGQTALAPGDLMQQWEKDGRQYYHYRTAEKVVPLLAVFSGKYVAEKIVYRGISIEHYYHATHEQNLPASTQAIKEALDYCLENFGTYPHNSLRIVEIPSHWNFGGMAMPGLITMVADNYFLIDQRDQAAFNLVAKRAIHEVAHQWWGHAIMPKQVAGSGLWLEGLAKYSEAVIMEKYYGKGSRWYLADQANRRYFRGRAFDPTPEQPLLLGGAPHLIYGKSLGAMMAACDLVGEDKMNTLLRGFVEVQQGKENFGLTTRDLVDSLKHLASSTDRPLLTDWFESIITYDIHPENVHLSELPDGSYQLRFQIKGARFGLDEAGLPTPIEAERSLPVMVFTRHPRGVNVDNSGLLYEGKLPVGEVITLRFQERPVFLGIDPYGSRPDKDLADNIVRLTLK